MILFSALLFVFLAKEPDWVTKYGSSARYPERSFLTGFGIQQRTREMDEETAKRLATDIARANLIEKVRVSLVSTVQTAVEEKGSTISEYARAAVQSSSSLELEGLETELYVDGKMFYALAYVQRSKLARLYNEKVSALQAAIREHLESGKRFEAQGKPTEALKAYLSCYPLLQAANEARTIVAVTEQSSDRAFSELDKGALAQVRPEDIQAAVNRVVQRPLQSVDDLAWHLSFYLGEQGSLEQRTILITAPSFRDTKMGSSFARYLRQVVEQELPALAGCTPVLTTAVAKEATESDLILTGTYWDVQNTLKVIMTARTKQGAIVASAEAVIPIDKVRASGMAIAPENFTEALSAQKQFAKDEVVGGGLNIDVWTDKGTENLLYTEGDTMKVFIRVSMPSYLRLLYQLSDGKRVLLAENYFINEANVNKVYELPDEFICSEPFGAEILQVFARTEEFEPLKTTHHDGYDYLAEDLTTALTATRGFKKAKMKTLQNETRLTITTVPR